MQLHCMRGSMFNMRRHDKICKGLNISNWKIISQNGPVRIYHWLKLERLTIQVTSCWFSKLLLFSTWHENSHHWGGSEKSWERLWVNIPLIEGTWWDQHCTMIMFIVQWELVNPCASLYTKCISYLSLSLCFWTSVCRLSENKGCAFVPQISIWKKVFCCVQYKTVTSAANI